MVLMFCVEFRELSHLTRDLSQAEKKITVFTSWITDKMTLVFTQNNNIDHIAWKIDAFCAFAQLLTTFIFFSAWDKSHVEWDNFRNSPQCYHYVQVYLFQKLATSGEHVVYKNCSKCQNKKQSVYTICSQHDRAWNFHDWTPNSMNNLLSYFGLVVTWISDFEKF